MSFSEPIDVVRAPRSPRGEVFMKCSDTLDDGCRHTCADHDDDGCMWSMCPCVGPGERK
jgi:hypothetical protein